VEGFLFGAQLGACFLLFMKRLDAHRVTLFITLCPYIDEATLVWRSKVHSDGTGIKGFFLLGIAKRKGAQISYHLPIGHWDDTGFAETLDRAPAWDGHTPQDVLRRLKRL
jgi:hypothetical protein